MEVHKASIAVASVTQEHGADVVLLGPIGTRPGDIAQLIRKRPSEATHPVFVSEAGPCGDWLYRYLTKTGPICWAVAPSLTPNKAGARVNTERRAATPWARLLRAGDLPPPRYPRGRG